MKKFLKWAGIIVVVIIILGVILDDEEGEVAESDTDVEATSEENTTEENVEEEETPTEEEDVTKAGIGDTATIADVSFTVNSVETATEISTGNEFIDPATTSGQFVILDVKIKNDKKESITIDSSFFKLLAEDDTEYDPTTDGNVMMNTNPDADFFLTQINPGLDKSGTVVFEVGSDFNVEKSTLQAQTGFWGTERIEISLNK